MSSSAAGGRSTLSKAVGDYSSRSSFTPFGGFGGGGIRTPSPFLERPASGRSAAPTHRGSEEILSNEYKNDQDLGSGSDDQQFAGRSSEFPPVRLAVGMEAAGKRRVSGPPDPVDRLKAVERLQKDEFAALRQELALLKAQIAQASQTASNVPVDLGRMLDDMSNVYALPCFANTVKGPMKRGASLVAPKSDTAYLARFCVANKTNEPTLNSLVFPCHCLRSASVDRNGVLDKPYDVQSALDKVHSLRAELGVQLTRSGFTNFVRPSNPACDGSRKGPDGRDRRACNEQGHKYRGKPRWCPEGGDLMPFRTMGILNPR
ncbi:unnamed protein product [Phytophthora fragariaefolia]|uniref:Unnamed protein product n=1 Tax=Phytophthora fragariaefolia TaxID=1490495 RepID=A0A9W7CQN7_9STRA|nr:unnamed protein product [Phytophthora fragariaefolia]